MSNHENITHFEIPAPPTAVGQRVRLLGWGGPIQLGWVGCEGVVIRFNRNGKPVIEIDVPDELPRLREVTDRHGAAAQLNEDGTIARILKELPR